MRCACIHAAQPGELSARKGDSTGDLAGSEAEGSETLSTQLRMSPLHEQSSQPGPAESEASEPPCSQLGASPVHEHAAQPGHEARPDAALDQARTAIVPAEPDLEVGKAHVSALPCARDAVRGMRRLDGSSWVLWSFLLQRLNADPMCKTIT